MANYRRGQRRGTTTSFTKAMQQAAENMMANAEDVYQETNKRIYDRLVVETPVKTGHLAGSLVATTKGAPEMQGPTNVVYSEGSGRAESYTNIDAASIGEKIGFYYRATYFLYQNYGTVFMPGKFWVQRVRAEYRGIARAVAREYGMKMR